MTYYVYKHTFPNSKVYIGITKQNPEKRWRNGFGYTHNLFLKNAIQKYGWENIKHEILFDKLTEEEAYQKEIELIAYYKSNQREYGYNLSTGGECGSKGVKKTYVWNKGKTNVYSDEIKQRISKGLKKHYATYGNSSKTKFIKGQKAWNKGKKTPLEIRKKLSEAHKQLTGSKAPRSKPILKISIETGEILKKYSCAKEAAQENGVSNKAILNCCHKKTKTSCGYIWKFERNDL